MKKILLLLLLCVASGLHAMRSPTDEEVRHGMVLVDAALGGDSDLLVSLLKDCSCVQFEVFGGSVALDGAITNGNFECVKVLVEFGADPNKADSHGWTPLYKAACSDKDACIKVLLKMGAYHSPHNTSENGFTPLHVAAKGFSWDYFESVEALLVGGADIMALDESGHSPIKYAVAFTQLKSTELLLQVGVSPFTEELSGESLMDIALKLLNSLEPWRCGGANRYEKERQKKRQGIVTLLGDYQARWRGMMEFCKAQHDRLGAHSSAHALPKDLYREIFKRLLRHE